jgi:hypothetical protein
LRRKNIMGANARTERGRFSFKVKEFADGTPFIFAEGPDHSTMASLDDAFIAFDLDAGTTLEQAQRIADFMNKNLAGMSMTIFDTHPLYRFSKAS